MSIAYIESNGHFRLWDLAAQVIEYILDRVWPVLRFHILVNGALLAIRRRSYYHDQITL